MALADGTFDEEELDLISDIASNYDISREKLIYIRDNPDTVSFTPPSSRKARLLQLYDLVELMLADHEIHEKELALCRQFAVKLGLARTVVDELVELMGSREGTNSEKYQRIVTYMDTFE